MKDCKTCGTHLIGSIGECQLCYGCLSKEYALAVQHNEELRNAYDQFRAALDTIDKIRSQGHLSAFDAKGHSPAECAGLESQVRDLRCQLKKCKGDRREIEAHADKLASMLTDAAEGIHFNERHHTETFWECGMQECVPFAELLFTHKLRRMNWTIPPKS